MLEKSEIWKPKSVDLLKFNNWSLIRSDQWAYTITMAHLFMLCDKYLMFWNTFNHLAEQFRNEVRNWFRQIYSSNFEILIADHCSLTLLLSLVDTVIPFFRWSSLHFITGAWNFARLFLRPFEKFSSSEAFFFVSLIVVNCR